MIDFPQLQNTRKFKRNKDGAVQVFGAPVKFRCGVPTEESPLFSLHGGKRGYLWVGSQEKGCYTHIPLSVLKRLIASAEAK